MSQENVEIVRRAWKDFKVGGVDATLAYYAEDCVCEDVPGLPDHRIYRGREGVLERSRRFREMWRDFDLEPVEFIDAGDDAVVVVTATRGHGSESDAPIESEVTFVYDVRDGRAIRDRAFMSRTDALEAAGLSEYSPPQTRANPESPMRRDWTPGAGDTRYPR